MRKTVVYGSNKLASDTSYARASATRTATVGFAEPDSTRTRYLA